MDPSTSRLVLHADDLGMNQAVNEGIFRGFRHGLLTSASALANAPRAGCALNQWKTLQVERAAGCIPSMTVRRKLDDPEQPFDLGVHLNLTQGRPLIGGRYPAELLDRDGRFPGVFSLFVRLQRHGRRRFQRAIRAELAEQIQFVCDYGLRPTHLNGHQYIEMLPTVRDLMPELLDAFKIIVVRVARERSTVFCGRFRQWPLAVVKQWFAARFQVRMDASGIGHPDTFFGVTHAGRMDLAVLRHFLSSALGARLVEIALHPGEPPEATSPEDRANGWHDPLGRMRPNELRMLISAELPAYLQSIGWRLGRLHGEHP